MHSLNFVYLYVLMYVHYVMKCPCRRSQPFEDRVLIHRGMIADCRLPIADCRLPIAAAEHKSPKEERAIALLLIEGHPSPLGVGSGVRDLLVTQSVSADCK